MVGANKGGVVALVEGIRGFVPFSQISTVSSITCFNNVEALFLLFQISSSGYCLIFKSPVGCSLHK